MIESLFDKWMLDIQLGRRNLSHIQRIAVAEKYRPIYEKEAQQKLEEGRIKGGFAKEAKSISSTQNIVEAHLLKIVLKMKQMQNLQK